MTNSLSVNNTTISITDDNGNYAYEIAASGGNPYLPADAVGGTGGVLVSRGFAFNKNIDIDGIRPTVDNINSDDVAQSPSIVIDSDDGNDIVDLDVTFSEAVVFIDADANAATVPTILLDTNSTPNDKTADFSYVNGDNSAVILATGSFTAEFTFDVEEFGVNDVRNPNTGDLAYQSQASLALNGDDIRDISGNSIASDLSTALPVPGAANSLSNNANIIIDTNVPTIDYVTIFGATNGNCTTAMDANDCIYAFEDNGTAADTNLEIRVYFTETVTIANSPTLTIETGTTDRTLTCTNNGTLQNYMVCPYTVNAGDESLDLSTAAISTSITYGSAATDIVDVALNPLDTNTFPTAGGSDEMDERNATVIDGVRPTDIAFRRWTTGDEAVGGACSVARNQNTDQDIALGEDAWWYLEMSEDIDFSSIDASTEITNVGGFGAGADDDFTIVDCETDGNVYKVVYIGADAGNGVITPEIAAGALWDIPGNTNAAAITATESVNYDGTAPTIVIKQGVTADNTGATCSYNHANEARTNPFTTDGNDPTNALADTEFIVITEADDVDTSTFTSGDITNGGIATGITFTLTNCNPDTGNDRIYKVVANAATTDGTIIPRIAGAAFTDLAGNDNTASVDAVDNQITLDRRAPVFDIATGVNITNTDESYNEVNSPSGDVTRPDARINTLTINVPFDEPVYENGTDPVLATDIGNTNTFAGVVDTTATGPDLNANSSETLQFTLVIDGTDNDTDLGYTGTWRSYDSWTTT